MHWYESQRKGLGFQFLDCIDVVTLAIQERPHSFPVKHRDLRGAVVRRFPFTVYFSIDDSELIVHAVFDDRQDTNRLP